MTEYLYRFENFRTAGPLDESDEPTPGDDNLVLRRYEILKRTRCGVWIGTYARRFVNQRANKQFAWPTVEQARVSFIARKTRQIAIHQVVIDRARTALAALEVYGTELEAHPGRSIMTTYAGLKLRLRSAA